MLRFCSSSPVIGLGTFARRPQTLSGLVHRPRNHSASGRRMATDGHAPGLGSGLPTGFDDRCALCSYLHTNYIQWRPLLCLLWYCRDLQKFRLAIVGDLHLVPDQMPTFESAQQHLNDALLGIQHSSNGTGCKGRPVGRLVQLGDLGGYEVRPGMLPNRSHAWPECHHVSRTLLRHSPV